MSDPRPAPQKRSLLITVISGKGGVGKTSLAVNTALAAAASDRKTLLVDGDLSLANADLLLGVVPHPETEDILGASRSGDLRQMILPAAAGLELLPGASGNLALAQFSTDDACNLAARIRELGSAHDLILCDTGPGLSATTLALAQAADLVLLVLCGEPAAFTDAYGLLKVLHEQAASASLRLLINRARDRSEALTLADRFRRVTQRFLGLAPSAIGWVPEDPCVGIAARAQSAFLLEFPQAAASRAVRDLAGRLVTPFQPSKMVPSDR